MTTVISLDLTSTLAIVLGAATLGIGTEIGKDIYHDYIKRTIKHYLKNRK